MSNKFKTSAQGQGRAFCAGGDVSAVVRDIRLGKWRRSADFMSLEYTLNYVMATYCKAQVSLLLSILSTFREVYYKLSNLF